MKPRNLIIAAALLAALSGGVWWAKKHPSAASSSTTPPVVKLAEVPQAQVRQVEIVKKGAATIMLQSQGGRWAITAPEQYAADQDAVTTLLTAFSPLNADTLVDDKPKDIAQFGLAEPSMTVTVHESNGKSDKFFIGNDVPAGSLIYVRLGSKPAVYAVASTFKTSLDKSVNDLRDKRLLTFDSGKVTSIELVTPKADIGFGKNNQGDWQIVKPQPYRADSFQVEEVLRKLGDAKMDLSSSAVDQKKTDAAFAGGQLAGTFKLADASGTQSLEVRKSKDDYYAKSSAVKGAYKISADLGQLSVKVLDDFRNKKIFDFGFSDPSKIDVQHGDDSKSLVRSGTDWKLNGKTMDAGSVQAFLDKLRDLSAAKFLTGGFSSPTAVIAVTSNEGKRVEKVEFAKGPEGYTARRENEPTLYQLTAKSVDDTLEASKGIKPAGASAKK